MIGGRTRGVWLHAGLFVVASAGSLYAWTRDSKATKVAWGDATIWTGRPDDVQSIEFDSSARELTLEARSDAHGRWFVGTSKSLAIPQLDGGAAPEPPKPMSFVSVGAAQKLVQQLAPLRAVREIGRIDAARAVDFGFKEPTSKLVVRIDGKEHRLTVGGSTPGGTDRYVRDEGTGDVYATRAAFLRELESGEPALAERELHDTEHAEFTSARVISGGTSRTFVRSGPPGGRRSWANESAPDKVDETATNWLAKVDRLRPLDYEELPSSHELVVRVEYAVKGGGADFVELAKVPTSGSKSEYFVRTEQIRLWAKVHPVTAEPIDQDLASVLK